MKGGWNSPEKQQVLIRNQERDDECSSPCNWVHILLWKHQSKWRACGLQESSSQARVWRRADLNLQKTSSWELKAMALSREGQRKTGRGRTENKNANTKSAHRLKQCSWTDETNRPVIRAIATTLPWKVIGEAERKIPTITAILTGMRETEPNTSGRKKRHPANSNTCTDLAEHCQIRGRCLQSGFS